MKSVHHKTVLPNGLRVVSERISSLRSISIGLWVNVGSRDEKPAESGLSHFLEHMVFKGTKKRTVREIAQSLESLGGHLNAFTSREQTCYYARVLDEHLPVAVDVLVDLVKDGLLNATDLEKEKKVVLEEIKDVEDNPADLIHDLYADSLWKGQSLGQPIIGTKESVSSFHRKDLVSFIGRHYRSDKMVVAASGNVDHQKLVRLVQKAFNQDNRKGFAVRTRHLPQTFRTVQVVRRKTAQTHLCLGVPAYEYSNPQRFALTLLNIVLGGGMSSRLFQSIREKLGLAYSVYSFLDYFEDTGTWGVYLATDAGQVQKAVQFAMRELKRIRREALSKKELEDAKSQIKGNMVISLESSSNCMNRLARNELYLGKYITLEATMAQIDKINPEDVQGVAQELIRPEHFTAAVLGPVQNGLHRALTQSLNN